MTIKNHRHDNDLYNDIEKIKAALMDTTQDTKDKAAEIISESMNTIKEKTNNAKESIESYASNKPFQSLGIALLAGAVIGYLLRK